jgi:transcriptional regulator with XRE-family HTH domain
VSSEKFKDDSLPAEIERIRTGRGLIQEEFAEVLGVRARTVQRWEAGESRPHRTTLKRIRALAPVSAVSEESRAALHTALDIVLERATKTVREKVVEMLQHYAGIYGGPSKEHR